MTRPAMSGSSSSTEAAASSLLRQGRGDGPPMASYGAAPGITMPPPRPLHPLRICGILSTAFCYGCVVTTLFLLVLPIECRRIELLTRGKLSKSISLGVFAAIAGVSQLVCPLIGMLSDRYRPRTRKRRRGKRTDTNEDAEHKVHHRWVRGRRMPYLLFGSMLVEIGLMGMNTSSLASCYSIYTFAFALAMVGINTTYCVMIALIPDLIPHEQTGQANGTLALLLVSGSLFGFGLFELVLDKGVRTNYIIYMFCMALTCTIQFFSANGLSGKEEDEEEVERKQGVEGVLASEDEHVDTNNYLLSTLPGLLSLGIIPTLQNMIYRPLSTMTWAEIRHAYWVDPKEHHDFFVVTLSRLFYYLGLSAQCFFLYFVHDVIHERENPEAAASGLAMITTAAGVVTCYPVGIISDRFFSGRRKPFVYGACAVLALSNIALLWCTTIRQMACVCATLGSANGIYLTMDTSLAVDTLDVLSEVQEEAAAETEDNINVHEEDAGEESSLLLSTSTEMAAEAMISKGKKHDGAAQLLGIWGVAGFVGSALGPLVGGPLLFYFGKSEQEDEDGGYSWGGYAVVLTLSAAYFACSAATLAWIRDHKL